MREPAVIPEEWTAGLIVLAVLALCVAFSVWAVHQARKGNAWRSERASEARGPVCVSCGCTDERPCRGGCAWASMDPPICTRCDAAIPKDGGDSTDETDTANWLQVTVAHPDAIDQPQLMGFVPPGSIVRFTKPMGQLDTKVRSIAVDLRALEDKDNPPVIELAPANVKLPPIDERRA